MNKPVAAPPALRVLTASRIRAAQEALDGLETAVLDELQGQAKQFDLMSAAYEQVVASRDAAVAEAKQLREELASARAALREFTRITNDVAASKSVAKRRAIQANAR